MVDSVRLIKKYPNRRLYDTRNSCYITLADVKRLVISKEAFQVVDAKSGEELTRSILLQIILEEESGGTPMFTHEVLSEFIRFYGNAMQGFMGEYLQRNIQAVTQFQQSMQPADGAGECCAPDAEAWAKFIDRQTPAMQDLLATYMERSKSVLEEMQRQFQAQSRSLLESFRLAGMAGMPQQSADQALTEHAAHAPTEEGR
ncbi:MAG TPA: polyhydroxyalkanoate synthesis repressor PhaR [Burkholderiales bacterium]|nr:polyhydroxyalkanoate synthesis repressor PhaR [Burkholderiales bacterium]